MGDNRRAVGLVLSRVVATDLMTRYVNQRRAFFHVFYDAHLLTSLLAPARKCNHFLIVF